MTNISYPKPWGAWAGSQRFWNCLFLWFFSLEAASATDLKLVTLVPFSRGFWQRMGPKWPTGENLQSPLLPRRKPKRRWVLKPFYPLHSLRKAPISGECRAKNCKHTSAPHRVCMREVAILFFALNIYQSQAQARQRTVCVCVCVCWGCRERAADTLILINSLKLSNTCHGVCTGLLWR